MAQKIHFARLFKLWIPCLTIALSGCLTSCETSKKVKEEPIAEQVFITPPTFNADSAYFFVKKQVEFGPRVPGTMAHSNTSDWIVQKLNSYNAKVTLQEFNATSFDRRPMNLKNIIASYNPDSSKRILLAAHWDTRPFADKGDERKDEAIDGANDGASGVGVLLEIARLMSREAPQIGIDIIFFDGEDWGNDTAFQDYVALRDGWESWWCLGSQYWGKNPHVNNYSAYYGILLDMVGGKNAKFFVEGYSKQFAPSVVDKVWNTASKLGYSNYFVRRDGGAITDDHYFVNKYRNTPMIDIIPTDPADNSFGSFHHTHDDNMDIISKETLEAVGRTVLQVIYNEDN
ncbi:MAG: M28 family peptidase [Bacteroidota bacterium]